MRALHGAVELLLAVVETPGDDLHLDPAGGAQTGDFGGIEVAIAGLAKLVLARQVQPDLEAAHGALFLLRHLAVDHPARGGHPLHATGLQQADVAHVVFVAHASFEHVGDGLEAAVRVRREAGDVVVRIVGAEFVEHQEGVEALDTGAADHSVQAHTGAVGCRLADVLGDHAAKRGHGNLQERQACILSGRFDSMVAIIAG